MNKLMTDSGVYQIKNKVNGKVYIGSSVGVNKRWVNHKNLLRTGKHHGTYLQHAWDKYGEETFEFTILKFCPKDKLRELENEFLQLTKSFNSECGYNIERDAVVRFHSEETRAKISKTHTGKILSLETRNRISRAKTGTNLSEEQKLKISSAQIGKVISEETKRKMSEAAKGRKVSEETKLKLSLAHTGKKLSLEHIEKTRARMKNFRHTEESLRKIREAKVGYTHSEITREKIRQSHLRRGELKRQQLRAA